MSQTLGLGEFKRIAASLHHILCIDRYIYICNSKLHISRYIHTRSASGSLGCAKQGAKQEDRSGAARLSHGKPE